MNGFQSLDVLVANAKQLNKDALTALYDEFLPRVFRYIYYQVNNKAVAEDLTSETFLKMLTAIRGFREDGKSFYPWLLRIAKNTTLDYLRTKSKQIYVELDEGLDDLLIDRGKAADLEQAVLAGLDAEEVKRALTKLTDEQQQVLLLKFTMGLSNAEVAKVIDKTEGSVKSLQVRALASLKRILDDSGSVSERVEPTLLSSSKGLFREA